MRIADVTEFTEKPTVYRTTLISGTKGVKNGVKGCPKRHLLHHVDHVTVGRFFLAKSILPKQLGSN
jgi:hypothetical protein